MMTKFSTIAMFAAVAAASSASAFMPASIQQKRSTAFVLSGTRVDSADLVKEALEISKKFGASSPEARLAWEAVEEVDASDNSEAVKGSLDNCDVDSLDDADCEEYALKLAELEQLLQQTKPTLAALQSMAADVQKIKIPVPGNKDDVKPAGASAALVAALEEAKRITAEKGLASNEAKVAWDNVEEIAAAKSLSNALGGSMSADECLVDAAIEACEALEELNRALQLKTST